MKLKVLGSDIYKFFFFFFKLKLLPTRLPKNNPILRPSVFWPIPIFPKRLTVSPTSLASVPGGATKRAPRVPWTVSNALLAGGLQEKVLRRCDFFFPGNVLVKFVAVSIFTRNRTLFAIFWKHMT